MQQTVVILGMPPLRDSLLGQVSGEATWAGSIHSSMNALGYTALPSDSLEETLLLYRIVGNLTTLVLLDSWQIDECWVRRFNRDFRCLLTEWHQSGIPVWKMVAAIIWPGCIHPVRLTSHIATDISLFQLGYEWCFSRENYRAWIPNQLPTYIGCSIEEYCTSVPYIPWKNRTNTVFIFAKHMEHFSNMKTSHEIFRTLSSNSRGSNRIEFVAPMNDPSSSVSNVQNVGRFSRFEFLKKVGESKVMLGIGNPSTSLSPYEALCMGTVFFNPISSYDKDDRNNRHLWNTQYDGLKYLNPPFVYNYFADDDSKLVELLELAITQEVPGRFIPEYMKRSSVTKRMMSFVNINWKSKALMEKAIRSKFGGEKYLNEESFDDSRLRSKNLKKIDALLNCLESGTCTANQDTVLILGSQQFRDSLLGKVSGEAIWSGSMLTAASKAGFTTLLADTTEEILTLYHIVGNLTAVVLIENEDVFKFWRKRLDGGSRLFASESHPEDIPIWKIVSAIFWPGCTHPLGEQWCITPENYHSWGPNSNDIYIGYSIENDCKDVPFIPWEDRPNNTFILAKKFEYISGSKIKKEIFERLSAASNSHPIQFYGNYENSEAITGVNVLSFMPRNEFQAFLSKTKVLLGVGSPRISPSPYEALCLGVAFFNPIIQWDPSRPQDRSAWQTQHDALKYLNPPYVYNYYADDEDMLSSFLVKAMKTEVPGRYIPEHMTFQALQKRVIELVNRNHKMMAREIKLLRAEFGGEKKQMYALRGINAYAVQQLIANASAEVVASDNALRTIKSLRMAVSPTHEAAIVFATNELPRLFRRAGALSDTAPPVFVASLIAASENTDSPGPQTLISSIEVIQKNNTKRDLDVSACTTSSEILDRLNIAIN
ncbi:hypothetical protein HDU83_001347 [Entophlyctis luteolus]|nr:hypothetical protein HDU83_001347 [Entophlyctis luteolus]